MGNKDSNLPHYSFTHKKPEFDIWNHKTDIPIEEMMQEEVEEKDTNSKKKIAQVEDETTKIALIGESRYDKYSGKFIQVEPQQWFIKDPVMLEKEYHEQVSWSKDDIAMFVKKYLLLPKEFHSIKKLFYNKTMKDIVLFYQTFKFHFKLQDHLNELYEANTNKPKKSQKA